MKSSYEKNCYKNVFKTLSYCINPKKIVEFGILEAYSLAAWIDSCDTSVSIEAHDIFDEFPHNAANYNSISKEFEPYSNVTIHRSDFYTANNKFEDEEIDILHVDIANNGDVFDYMFRNYMKKISAKGVCVLEGGSKERDNVYWMNKFKKPKIQPIIEKYKNEYDISVLQDFPSITMVRHKRGKV